MKRRTRMARKLSFHGKRRSTREIVQFAAFIFTVWGGSCFYMAWRLTEPLDPGSPWRTAGWAIAAHIAVLVPWAMVRQRRPHPPRLAMPAAYTAMSFAAMLLPPVIVRDLAWFAMLGIEAGAPGSTPLGDPAARHAWAHGLNAAALAAGALLTLAGWLQARRNPIVRRVRIPVDGLHPSLEGLRIVLIADLHAGATIRRRRIATVVALARGLRPDLVAVAGDLADGHVRDVLPLLQPLRELRPRLGTFYVTGNHDYYWDPAGWYRAVGTLGMTALTNESRVVARGRLVVAGIPDPTGAEFGVAPRPDSRAALAGTPHGAFRLMLSHQPDLADAAVRAGADLVVSGHTHGGQLYPWALIAHRIHRCVSGLCRVEFTGKDAHSGWLYVTAGANYWGAPNRLGVPTEVVLLTLSRRRN